MSKSASVFNAAVSGVTRRAFVGPFASGTLITEIVLNLGTTWATGIAVSVSSFSSLPTDSDSGFSGGRPLVPSSSVSTGTPPSPGFVLPNHECRVGGFVVQNDSWIGVQVPSWVSDLHLMVCVFTGTPERR